MMGQDHFDIIVVGGGHAGIEAVAAADRLGKRVALVTPDISRIGVMSCNPAIGGLAKGHMVREIDVLGGVMGLAADACCIQFKRLNASKGPAVRGTRMQEDKDLYARFMLNYLRALPNVTLIQGEVKAVILEGTRCVGVVLHDGAQIRSRAVVLTTGTFMNAIMYTGLKGEEGGRAGEKATKGLSDQLRSLGFDVRRLKTGTPARLDRNSIRWEILEPQKGDDRFYPFSFRSPKQVQLPQVLCYISRTTPETHDIIRKNLHLSPMFQGIIEGVGPRYCPSIEDKVTRFSDRDSHLTFLEPEGLNTNSIYLQGISTSLPAEIQDQFLRTIPGLENVNVLRYGYAVEYDFIVPTQIFHSLETRYIKNLFLAGQINGTSGYEEAAAQGILAGINAVRAIENKPPFILTRDQAYMAVLVDDLVTKGTNEPYRMLTSRAEHRLVLREDNTLDRLGEISIKEGLVSADLMELILSHRQKRERLLMELGTHKLTPKQWVQEMLVAKGSTPLLKAVTYEEILRRPEISWQDLYDLGWNEGLYEPDIAEAVEIEVKYSGYIRRQNELIAQMKRYEEMLLPENLDYSLVRGLSKEEVEKLSTVRPRTLAQASRISGVNPSAIQCLMVYLKMLGKRNYEGSREQCI
ncbi:MAG: tRNA uridine-5-carboxymethylaminomethyl(34) synthesis enzyme MnmG [Bdellovibrionaceae bacterium]|nr:tRNA uridine-5-carboxymethylaminomethyl(34) synthesis enzyme MnmG [Pseudobdellovibrionaceae bacterium]MDW8189351.1 tRNA uridine-5-carboxymethylaminomethyl(34) synthesis enzyme MnmG [Pseudobdellovibrionaceae bacterium]